MKSYPRLLSLAALLLAPLPCAAADDTLTDKDLVAYAQTDFDRGEMMYKHIDVGVHHGKPVVADFPCADVCPDATIRVIHYRLDDGQACSSVQGVERKIVVPAGVGKVEQTFCVPRVLAAKHLERWPQY